MKIILLKWKDARSYAERSPLEMAKEATLIDTETCGLLIDEDDDRIIIGQTLFNFPDLTYKEIDNYIAVPKRWITQYTVLGD